MTAPRSGPRTASILHPVWLVLIAACHPGSAHSNVAEETRPDTAADQEHIGGCVDSVALPDGSIDCAERLRNVREGWNCCSEANNTCRLGANTRRQTNCDGSSTLAVQRGAGYYPVLCTTTKQRPLTTRATSTKP